MVTKRFTTGLPALDHYIGGLRSGDSFLSFFNDRSALREVIQSIIEEAVRAEIPVLYISTDGFLNNLFTSTRKFKTFNPLPAVKKPKVLLNSLKRFTSLHGKNAIIILDDLSEWKNFAKSDRFVIELFTFLTDFAANRKSVLISTAVRTAFNLEQLALLKDTATVCLDGIQRQGETYIVPLSLRGRYVPQALVPLQLKMSLLKKPVSHSAELISPTDTAQADNPRYDIFSSDERYRTSFYNASTAMVLFDIRGDFKEVNREAERFLGYTADEFRVLSTPALIGLDDKIKFLRFISSLRKKKNPAIEISIVKRDGKVVPSEILAGPVQNGLYLAMIRDLTDQRKREYLLQKEEQNYRSLIDHAPHPVLILYNNKPVFCNTSFCNTVGIEMSGSVVSKNLKQFFTNDSFRQLQKDLRGGAFSEHSFRTESQLLHSDGHAVDCSLTISAIPFDGKQSVQLSFVDITSQKEFVRSLSYAEERSRVLIEQSRDAAGIVRNGIFQFVNQTFLRLFGFESPDEITEKEMTAVISESSREQVSLELQKRPSPKQTSISLECTGLRKDNTTFDTELVVLPVEIQGSQLKVVWYRDITVQKREQQELRQKLKDVRLLDELLQTLNTSNDTERITQKLLHKLMERFSWEMGGVYLLDEKDKNLKLSLHKNLSEKFISKMSPLNLDEGIGGFMAKTQEPHLISLKKYPSYLPNRSLFSEAGISRICLLPLVAKEKIIGLVLLGSRKEIEQTSLSMEVLQSIVVQAGAAIARSQWIRILSKSEERLQSLIDSSPEVMYTAAPDGSMTYVNSNIEQLTGYTAKEFYRNPTLWLRLVHPDDKKILLERTTALNQLPPRVQHEYRILPKGKASYRSVVDTASLVKGEDGIVHSIHGMVSDQTNQIQTLQDIAVSNDLQTSIISSLSDGIVAYDLQLHCIQWNRGMEELTGFKRESVISKSHQTIFTLDGEENFENLLRKALGGEEVSSDAIQYEVSKSKKKGFLAGRYSPMRDAKGEITGVVGILAEVSERKRLETDVQESEQMLRNVIDTMDDVLVLTDLKGVVVQVNRTFLNTLGYTRMEAIESDFPYPWLVEQQMGKYVLWLSTLREKNWLHDFDMTWKAKDGRLIPMSLSTTFLRNATGEPIAILNIARDITERTRLGKDLEKRNKQIEHLNRIITEANQTLDFDEVFSTTITKEIKEIVPCDEISVGLVSDDGKALNIYARWGSAKLPDGGSVPLHNTLSQFVITQQKPFLVPDFSADERYSKFTSSLRGLRSQMSLPISLKGTTFGTLNIFSKDPHVFAEEHLIILEPIAQQVGAIIDRVRLFKQVTEDAAYIHNLLDSIDSVVYTVDTRHRILEVNRAWFEFIRESGEPENEEYHGMNLFDVLPNESLKVTIQNVVDQLLDGTVRFFSQEFVYELPSGKRIFQLSINPMVIQKTITGLVFTHTDITALKTTETELKKSNEQLLALNQISSLISTSLKLTDVLTTSVPLLKRTLEASCVALYLVEPETNDLVLTSQVGFETKQLSSITRLSQRGSATGEVIKTKDALYISSKAYLDERIIPKNREVLKEASLDAMAVIPLVSKDKVLGALDIFYHDAHEFSISERQMLALIGNQLGSAIENAELYSELRLQISQLTVLYELSQQLTSTLDIDQMFQVVYQSSQRVIPLKKFTIELYDDQFKQKTPVFCVETINGEAIVIPKISTPTAIELGSPVSFVVSTKHSYQNAERSAMYIPMVSKESIIGIMSVEGNQEGIYSDTHLRLLESIANLTAIALEKGKLYEETVQKSLEIQRRNKELDDFTYVVSHDLKEPLISVEGFSKILQLDYQDLIQPEGREYLESIVGATARMKGLIDDLLMLSRVSRPSESFKSVPISDIIDDIKTDMEFTIKQKGVNVIVPEQLPLVYGNETQLKIVFRNLIGNAIKFNKKANPVVEIGFRNEENNSYLFYVKDNGIGIDKEFHEKVFVIFQRLHRREEYEGTGAGLAIVKKIVELHKGKIWLESELGNGSTFFFTIPKSPFNEP